jgi:acetyl esterase/lipase
LLVDHGLPGAGVLLALHGGGEVADGPDNPWAPAVAVGWTVYRPVSTQRSGAGLATWANLDLAVDECRTHLNDIGPIDAIGSFSLGGSLALRLIAEVCRVPALMIAPSLRASVVEAAAPKAGDGVIDIITGEHDPFLELTSDGVAQLSAAGADVRVEVFPGVAHDFPPDFAQCLTRRLDDYRRRT